MVMRQTLLSNIHKVMQILYDVSLLKTEINTLQNQVIQFNIQPCIQFSTQRHIPNFFLTIPTIQQIHTKSCTLIENVHNYGNNITKDDFGCSTN